MDSQMIPGLNLQNRFTQNLNPEQSLIGIYKGEFIANEDKETIFLQLENNKKYDLSACSFCATFFNESSGSLLYPQPTIVDSKGKILTQGDIVIIAFWRGSSENPVVLGSIVPAKKNDFFHDYTFQDYEQRKIRHSTEISDVEFSDPGDGEIIINVVGKKLDDDNKGTGNITINIVGLNESDDDENGSLSIVANGKLTITTNKSITLKTDESVLIDSPEILLGKDAQEPLVLGNQWAALFKAHTHPTPTGPSGVPVTASQADSCLSGQNKTL